MEPSRVTLRPRAIAWALGTVTALLLLASVGGHLIAALTGHERLLGLIWFFDVDSERNLPTAFSTFLLFFAAVLLVIVALFEKTRTQRGDVFYWSVLAVGFLFMAGDEAFSVHERLIEPGRILMGNRDLGVFYYAWVIPYSALVLIIALPFSRFMWRLPVRTRAVFAMAAILFVGGALGVEMIGGRFAEANGRHNLTYQMITTVEEGLEMAGVVVFIWALLVHLADGGQELHWRFENPRHTAVREPGDEGGR